MFTAPIPPVISCAWRYIAMTVSNALFLFANCGFNFRLFIVAPFRFEDWFPLLEVCYQSFEHPEWWKRLTTFENSNHEFVTTETKESSVTFPAVFFEPSWTALVEMILEGCIVVEVSSADFTAVALLDFLRILLLQSHLVNLL